MKINICTDTNQSARLLACGVDSKTADMLITEDLTGLRLSVGKWHPGYKNLNIAPAWSLSALCSLIPSKIEAPHAGTPCYFRLYHTPDKWMAMYHDGKESGDAEDYYWQYASQQDGKDPIEVCVAIIEWLMKKNISLNKTEE